MFLLVMSSVPNLIIHNPASAQTIHRCEEYRRTNVGTYYDVMPNIPGSSGGFFNPGISLATCHVPVIGRKCFYWESSEEQWRPCGQDYQHLDPNDPDNIAVEL
ncbi:hypothetical protein [Okeania sp.]|uniref:hypothetical protein n=1 Tax=Okeania sp. TaxID=3100323 RepID=UPI002B4B7FEA|nr:hypothetical protein [Okeania sp.]MEB3343275.1 hypothetical protein [Okeania sp.]